MSLILAPIESALKSVETIEEQYLPVANSDIARVQTIQILGVAISDRLSVNQHVTNVIASSAQTFHASRVFSGHGLNKDALEGVFKAGVIAKLTYANPALWGSPRPTTGRKWSLSSAVECVSATAPPTRLR